MGNKRSRQLDLNREKYVKWKHIYMYDCIYIYYILKRLMNNNVF